MNAVIRRWPQPSAPPPEPVYTSAEQRQRRQHWLAVDYRGEFDLAAEVSAIVGPLAGPTAALPHPLALRSHVDQVADAVHELLSTVVGMLAESKHLDSAAHARTVQAVRDLAQRPREPQISEEQISSGRWAAVLTTHVAAYRDDLAAYLGRTLPPGHPKLTGPSASERLEAALRVLDAAARNLQRLIPKVAAHQALPSIETVNAANRARRERERADRAVAKIARGARS